MSPTQKCCRILDGGLKLARRRHTRELLRRACAAPHGFDADGLLAEDAEGVPATTEVPTSSCLAMRAQQKNNKKHTYTHTKTRTRTNTHTHTHTQGIAHASTHTQARTQTSTRARGALHFDPPRLRVRHEHISGPRGATVVSPQNSYSATTRVRARTSCAP